MKSLVTAAAVALSLSSGLAAQAATIGFDSITGQTLNGGSGPVVAETYFRAVEFVAQDSGTVTSLTAPISLRLGYSGTTEIVFSFFTDGGIVPGTQIGTSSSLKSSSPGFVPDYVTGTGWSGVSLTSGVTYWLVATLAAGSPQGYWYATATDLPNLVSYVTLDAGQSFLADNGDHMFKIELTDAPASVPLPAGLPLLGGSLLLLLALRRKSA